MSDTTNMRADEIHVINQDLIDFINSNLTQLGQSISLIEKKDYLEKRKILSGASIGSHIRHILELFVELEKGYESGLVQYEARARDKDLETDPLLAASMIEKISASLLKPNKHLKLSFCFDLASNKTSYVSTNYWRELAYNLEHMIHHMAIIRIGFSEITNYSVPADYGVAFATLQYRKSCAQ
jgi:hypothetical protein